MVNSYLKKADESDDPLFGVEEWNRSIEKMDGIRKKLSYHQHMDLRYEDLVADPKACFSSVCSFLELAYEPIHERSGKRYLEEMGSIGEMESMVHVNQPINPSSVGNWKNELDPKVLEQVEHLIKEGSNDSAIRSESEFVSLAAGKGEGFFPTAFERQIGCCFFALVPGLVLCSPDAFISQE